MRKHTLLLIGILILATFLRLYHFTSLPPGLYPDEAMNGNNALEAIRTGDYKVYYPENNGREGLFMNIQSLFIRATGILEPWALRLPSPFFGILTVLGLYFLGKELMSRNVGLLASFLLATNFWHINFSRIGFRAIMAPFFLVWAVALLLIALRKAREITSLLPTTYYLLSIGGIMYGLGFHSYIAYRVSPILIFFILIYYWRQSRRERWQKQFVRAAACFLLAAFFAALPIGIHYLKNTADFMGRTTQVSVFSSPTPLQDLGGNIVKTLGMFNGTGDGNWRHNYPGRPQLFLPVGILFLIGIGIAIKNIVQKSNIKNQNYNSKLKDDSPQANTEIFHFPFSFFILFLWFGLATLPVVISNEGLPHALRSILLIPPAVLLAAIGGVYIYEWTLRKTQVSTNARKILLTTYYLLLTLLVFEAYHTYFILWGKDPNAQGAFGAEYVALGRALNELPADMPKYVVVETGGVLVRGIPMPAQTVMFMTDTYLAQGQQAKNIHYVLSEDREDIPEGALTFLIR